MASTSGQPSSVPGMQSLHELDDWLASNLPNVHALPQKVTNSIHEYTTILYTSLTQYGPPAIPNLPSLSNLPDFVAGPSKLAPPPPPQTVIDRLARLWRSHPYAIVLVSVGAGVGLSAAAGYSVFARDSRPVRGPEFRNGRRAEAVVILGGDTPLGEQLATSLSGQGFIVLPTFNSTASQQAFMRQVRPSSQGYVKPLLLNDSVKPARGGSIESFTAALSSALELKWPLTGAGDPFARSGERIRVAGVINALSWDERASFDENAHDVASLVEQRLSTPFAALHALLPILRSLADDRCTEQPAVVLTLVAPKSSTPGPASITRAAALESMRSLAHDCSKSRTPLTRVVRCATLQVRAPHTTSNAASAPHAPRRTTINPRGETIPSTKSSQVLGSPNDDMSVLSRTTARLLLLPSSTPLRAFYVVGPPLRVNLAAFLKSRVPEHASLSLAQVFVAAPSLVWTHATAVSVRLISMLRRAGPRLGFGGAAPRRQPAFGPGPGPVSNSHSRTAIGRGATAAGSTNASAASTRGRTRSSSSTRKSTRPLSTHSANASSEEESNGPSSSNGGACMESSGLLSSVPSSAFGDGDQLSTHGVESPTFSSRGPNSPHWGPSSTENATASGSSVFEDYAGTTPSASRVASSAGFQLPSEASSRHAASHAEDGPWMGPPSREAPSPHLAPHSETRSGVDSPLGQSWVALGQSQTENAPS